MYWYVDLLNRIETVVEGNKQEGGGVPAKALLDYPHLSCPPSQQSGNEDMRHIEHIRVVFPLDLSWSSSH